MAISKVKLPDNSVQDIHDSRLPSVYPRIYVGTCPTAAATAAKVVTTEEFPLVNGNPVVGTTIAVKFSNTNTIASPTLNVNNTGAHSIYYNNAIYTSAGNIGGYANRYSYFIWDGTNWVWLSHGTDNDVSGKQDKWAEVGTLEGVTTLTPTSTGGAVALVDGEQAIGLGYMHFVEGQDLPDAYTLGIDSNGFKAEALDENAGALITLDGNGLAMHSTPITGLPTPTANDEAATKGYVDSVVPTDAVKYTAQTLTDAQKTQARTNIGAGTSSFSGNYNDLTNKPTIDSSMSPTSENPVQNKVIYAQLQTKVGSETVDNIVELTKAQYDALATKDPGTLYIITDAGEADGYVSITGFEQTQSSSVSGGNNVWTVYLSNGQSFSLTVKNGEQGNTGSSVAYPYELVNNLTTDDATKGLSAAQGKVLYQMFGSSDKEIPLSGAQTVNGLSINGSTNKWQTGLTNVKSAFFLVEETGTYEISAISGSAVYAILTSNTYSNGGTPAFASAYPMRYTMQKDASIEVELTSGQYFWFRNENLSAGAFAPSLTLKGVGNPVIRESDVPLIKSEITGYLYEKTLPVLPSTSKTVKIGEIGAISNSQEIKCVFRYRISQLITTTVYLYSSSGTIIGSGQLSGDLINSPFVIIKSSASDDNAYISISAANVEIGLGVDVYKKTEATVGDVVSDINEGGDTIKFLYQFSYGYNASARILDATFEKGKLYYVRFGGRHGNGSGRSFLSACTFDGTNNADFFIGSDYVPEYCDTKFRCTKTVSQMKFYTTCEVGFVQIYEVLQEGAFNTLKKQRILDDAKIGESIALANMSFWDKAPMKIVFLDCSYKYFSPTQIKRIISQAASSGVNCFEFGFWGGGRGLSFKLDDMTFISNGKSYDFSSSIMTSTGKYLTEGEVEDILSYANGLGIEIVPSVDAPGHMKAALIEHPEFWYSEDGENLDFYNDDACEFALNSIELYAKWFSAHGCKHFNIGADEWYNILNGYSKQLERGRDDYAIFINRLASMVAKYHYVVHCWNDALYINDGYAPLFNRGLVVDYWSRPKTEWASVQHIKKMGHMVVNSSQSIYWVAGDGPKVTEAQMRAFNVHNFGNSGTVSWTPAGAKFCVWIGTRESPVLDDDGAAIADAIIPLIVAFGETVSQQL